MNWFLSDFNIQAWRHIRNYEPTEAPDVSLIYGPRGLGKSTMLRYLYQKTELKSGSIITDALSFAHQYAYAAQENKLKTFRQRYRSTRLLLIDDLQHLAGKIKTIEELQYTYEHVIENGGKMVITFEAGIPELKLLGDRLASRFLSGLVISIDHPQENELESFLAEYIHEKQLLMEKSILGFIAKRLDNLADAMRAIEQFIEYAELQEDELSMQCFQAFWEEKVRKESSRAEPMNIIREVAQTLGISIEEVLGASRKPRVNEARQLAIYMIRILCQISYSTIGDYFNRNHSSMISSYKKMQEKLTKDQELYAQYELLLNIFGA